MDLDLETYRLLFEANPRPMWVFDNETLALLVVNHAACAHYGWSRDELLTMTIRDIRPPEELPSFERGFAQAPKQPNARFSRATRHRTKDGRILEVNLELRRLELAGRPATLVVVTDVTGIAEVERRFQLLVQHSADGIAITNEDNIVEYVSPGAERILGFSSGEVVGTSGTSRTHPDDLQDWTPPAPGETKSHVARVQHLDDSWRWIESATTNLTHDPAVRGFVSNYRDITARKTAEQALLEWQRRLEFLLSATSAITRTSRASGDFGATFLSANVRDVLGYEPDEFYGDPEFWLRNIHVDDSERVVAGMQILLQRGSYTLEYRFRHRDGSHRWMRDVARVIREPSGEPLELVGYWIDVTEHANAIASLRGSEANFRTLIERAPMATFVHHDGHYLYVNPAAVAMLGYDSAQEMIGRPVLDFVHPDDRERVRERMLQTVRTGSTPAGVGRMLRRDGTVFAVEVEGVRLDYDGKPSNVVMGHDVTERHQMFARMAMADRMLSVGTLAAGVAHEINNPLAYIGANLDILARELPDILATGRSRLASAELQGLVSDAREGVARVRTIVRDLRALSRPDDEASGPVDVLPVLESSIKMLGNEIRHRARVVPCYEDNLPAVQGHASRLGQVFLNILLNAAQAIAEGRADQNEIRVGARATADRRHVCVEIEDTGVGMPSHVIRRIFDPFFTTKDPGVGTGLGLSISHQIVRAMQGEITVDSSPGRGSKFRVMLPVACTQQTDVASEPASARAIATRILLIDDEAAVGRSIRTLLAPDNDVVPVTRAQEALDRLAGGECFDAIVCDLMMPEISGIEFYQQLARVAPDCTRRIIFMTGGAFTPQAREFLAKLGQPHIEKPFTEIDLRRAIERIVR
jgi:PAS domain S-box-containing protein